MKTKIITILTILILGTITYYCLKLEGIPLTWTLGGKTIVEEPKIDGIGLAIMSTYRINDTLQVQLIGDGYYEDMKYTLFKKHRDGYWQRGGAYVRKGKEEISLPKLMYKLRVQYNDQKKLTSVPWIDYQ